MKSVLVVGAGPAGLVAAKTLLQHAGGTQFKVTVFEAAERVGGMWRARRDEEGDKCSPHMKTNLSRFTVAFSDLSWHSVKLADAEDGEHASEPPPMFPKAWQVGRYLEEYAKRFIPEDSILLAREVVNVERSVGETQKWTVSSIDKTSQVSHKDEFDHLIIASGFFGEPYNAVDNWAKYEPTACAKMRHSAKFRDLSSLTSSSGNVVVIGGGISGSEAAAQAAFQISNARYAPGTTKATPASCKVFHIFNRPFYCLPRYLPQEPYNPAIQDFNLAPHFLPLDLILYNLSRRGQGRISASNIQVPPEKAKKGHDFLRSVLGGDQRDLGSPELVYRPEHTQYPAFTGISDTYSEFVRSGDIVPIQGHAWGIRQQHDGMNGLPITNFLEVTVDPRGHWSLMTREEQNHYHIKDVAAIIEATGFKINLNFLSDSIKTDFTFDENCSRIPLLLGKGSIFKSGSRFNGTEPGLAFVGLYEGPYWGVMEGQARLVAETWAPRTGATSQSTDYFYNQDQRSLRKAIKGGELDVPQFWMSDYVGLIDEFSQDLGIKRHDSSFNGQSGPAFPARYIDSACDKDEADKVVEEVVGLLKASNEGARFVAAATFRGMQGAWTLERKIDSRHSSMPGGTFKGTAHFHPRLPTSHQYTAEYLYMEEGILTMDNGLSFPATRRYVYRYNETTDSITAWFTEEDGENVGNFFNQWEFHKPEDTEHGWLAKGSHWCSPDTYKNTCEFRFRGANLETFGITYEATGPKKDYTHETWYRRPAPTPKKDITKESWYRAPGMDRGALDDRADG